MNIVKSLPVVAKALGEQMGVRVIVKGDIAKTNGKVIYLPQLPEDDEEATLLARGFLDHEAGHVRLTDFEVSEDDPYHANLANIIEDIRIEQEMGRLYPGCAVNLRNLANHMAAKGKFDFDPDDPAHLFLGWCLSRCRSRILRQDGLTPVFEKANQILTPLLGPELLGKVARLLDTVGNLDSTEEASRLAKRIIDLLKQEQQQCQQPEDDSNKPDNSTPPSDGGDSGEQSDGSGQQDQDQESSKSDTDKEDSSDTDQAGNNQDSSSSEPDSGKDDGGDEADNGQDGEGEQTQNQGENSQGQSQGKEDSASDMDSGDSPGGDDPQLRRQTLEQILTPGDSTESYGDLGEMVADELEGKATDARMSEEPERVSMMYPGESLAQHNRMGPPPDLFEVRKKTSALRARLGSLIQASKLKRSCAGRSGRNIDHRVLSRLPVGDTRIFRRKEDKKAINTAVIILLDRSSSMGHSGKMFVASQATLAMADALRTVPGVSVATAAFPGWAGQIIPLTPFGATPARTLKNYGIRADGGTPLAAALGWAAVQFAARQEARKILVVVTDGEPTNPRTVKDYLHRLAVEGIEQMAIGIEDHGRCGIFFSNYRSINNVGELPKALFEMLQKSLTE